MNLEGATLFLQGLVILFESRTMYYISIGLMCYLIFAGLNKGSTRITITKEEKKDE